MYCIDLPMFWGFDPGQLHAGCRERHPGPEVGHRDVPLSPLTLGSVLSLAPLTGTPAIVKL
jgi:hypothetical protein